MSHSALAIANEFLKRARDERRQLTHMQLQKLVYIAHGWNLALHNRPLIDETFEAWELGPVSRKLYDALRKYGRRPVTELIRWGDDTPFDIDDGNLVAGANLSLEDRAVIDQIWETFKDFEGFQLSALTHRGGSPWEQVHVTGENRPISNTSIKNHFSNIANQP